MAKIGGLASLLGSKPLSDKELKEWRIDTVRNKLCSAIGRSVYYYQGLLHVIKNLIHLHFFRKGQSGEMFDALLHEAPDKTTFKIFDKIYSCKVQGVLVEVESIRNSIMHSNYWVNEYSVWSEKPRLDKTENKELFKKDMNLNTDFINSFTGIVIDIMELVNKIHLSEFTPEYKQEFDQTIKDLKFRIGELKSNISKTNKDISSKDELIKALMYKM